ncbi:MAG: DUF1559 domain-containing protein [Gemmataceae bacterium]
MRSYHVVAWAALCVALASCAKKSETPKPEGNNNPGQTSNEQTGGGDTGLAADLKMVPAQAVGFASVRVDQVWKSDLFTKMKQQPQVQREMRRELKQLEEGIAGIKPENVERVTLIMHEFPPEREEGVSVVLTTKQPYDKGKLLKTMPVFAEPVTKDGLTYYPGKRVRYKTFKEKQPPEEPDGMGLTLLSDKRFAFGGVEHLKKITSGHQGQGPLSPVLASAAKQTAPVVVGGHLTPALGQLKGMLAQQKSPFLPLADTQTALVTIDVSSGLTAKAQLNFGAANQAAAGATSIKDSVGMARAMLDTLADNPDFKPLVERGQGLLKAIAVTQKENMVAVDLEIIGKEIDALQAEAAPLFQKSSTQATRSNNLRQFALAALNYEAAQGRFPGNIYSKDGKALLSWRVAILPYIEQDQLYRQFKLDEPWDSPDNMKLLKQMPEIYVVAGSKSAPDTTYYRGFEGKGAFLQPPAKPGLPAGIRIIDIRDGTSNTIMFVEAGEAVPWTKPEGLPFDPQKPLPKLGAPGSDKVFAVFCDGHSAALPAKLSDASLRAAITINGAEATGKEFTD